MTEYGQLLQYARNL